jgi:hypothetical protein
MAGMAADAAVVIREIRRILRAFQQAAIGTLDRIIRCAEAGLDHASAIPARRRMAAQAKITGSRDILVGDIDRRPEQRIARGIGHHRSTPGAVRTDPRVVADKAAVAGTTGVRRFQRIEQARLRAVRREIQRKDVPAGQQKASARPARSHIPDRNCPAPKSNRKTVTSPDLKSRAMA